MTDSVAIPDHNSTNEQASWRNALPCDRSNNNNNNNLFSMLKNSLEMSTSESLLEYFKKQIRKCVAQNFEIPKLQTLY